MIYTTYFAKLKDLPKHIVPIAICAKVPDGYTGLQYKKLAPPYQVLMDYKNDGDEAKYDKAYKEQVLDRLDANQLVNDLLSLAKSKDIALVCYEKSASFCHRQLVADWLKEANYKCKEWDGQTQKRRVVMAGSRDFDDEEFFRNEVLEVLEIEGLTPADIEDVCGKCKGPDTFGERLTRECGGEVKYFIPNWNDPTLKNPKAAGPIRNEAMAKYASEGDEPGILIAFWDGESRGTKSMIDYAKKYGLQVNIIQTPKKALTI